MASDKREQPRISPRLSLEEYMTITAAAERARRSPSDYVRLAALDRATGAVTYEVDPRDLRVARMLRALRRTRPVLAGLLEDLVPLATADTAVAAEAELWLRDRVGLPAPTAARRRADEYDAEPSKRTAAKKRRRTGKQ